jgi:PKD repeat protein
MVIKTFYKTICLISFYLILVACDKDDFRWNLPRKNGIDSLQNQNSTNPDWPVASFSASATSVTLNSFVDFLNTSSQNPTNSFWTFSGGNPVSSTEFSPSIQYNQVGRFDVKLLVSNDSGIDSVTKLNYIEVYYLKNFSNGQWDGWVSNGWDFSSSQTCPGCIYAWQNSSNTPLSYTLTKSFNNLPLNCTLDFNYNIYSPAGTLKVKIDGVEVWSTSGYGTGNPSISFPSFTNFTLTFEATVGYSQTIYLNDIKIRP